MSNQLQNVLDEIKVEKDSKLLPENIKKGVQIFDITGTLEGASADVPVKLFETQEEMQADTNAKEGDLAVVYRSEVKNATVDSKFQIATFPETVVLSEAMTDYTELTYRATDSSIMFDGRGHLDNSGFTMDCWVESDDEYKNIRIEYTSEDGITYIRTDTLGNPVDFTTEIYYTDTDTWNDAIGYFIQVGSNTFDGLFQCKRLEKTEYISFPLLKDIPTINENYDALIINHNSENQFSVSKIKTLIERIQTENTSLVSGSTTLYINTSGELISVWGVREYEGGNYAITFVNSFDYNTRQMTTELSNYGQGFSKSGALKGVYAYKLDLENMSYTSYPVGHQLYDYKPNSTAFYHLITNGLNVASVAYRYTSATNEFYTQYFQGYKDTSTIKTVNITITPSYYYWASEYIAAPTQLTLNNPNELLPGKIAYGKNGVVTGDGTIYTQISNFDLFQSQGMDLLNNYTILATNTAIDKLGDVNTLETIACEYKKFDKPEELAEYDIHRIQNDTKYLAIKGGLEYRLYDLNFNLLDSLTFTEKQTIATLDSFMQNTSDLLLYQTTGTTTTHYRWIRITDTFEKIDYSIVGGTSVHIFAYHVFNNTLYLAFDNGGSYMYIYKLTTSGATSQLYKTSKAIDYTYQGFANFCEYEGVLYCSLVCNYNSTEYTNDVVKITSSGSTTAVYSGAYNEPMVVTVNGYAVSKNGTYRVTDFTTPISTVSRTYSYYSNYIPYYDVVHDAIIDYDYLYISVAGSTFRRDGTLRTVIPNTASGAASSLITDISNYEVMTILNIPMEDGTKLSFNMMVYLNKGESDKGYKLIDLLNLETNEYRNLYLGCINTLQKQYDNTISPKEYDAALNTVDEILGEEV